MLLLQSGNGASFSKMEKNGILNLLFLYRDPKEVDYHEYRLFYQNTFKDFKDPLAWHHFSGASDDGISFKGIVYLPSSL
jgi:HSP90 family molecular chaperone